MGVSQIYEPVKWNFYKQQISESLYELVFIADIDPGWAIYSNDILNGEVDCDVEICPIPVSFEFNKMNSNEISLNGGIIELDDNKSSSQDPIFLMKVTKYIKKATFKQLVEIKNKDAYVSGFLTYMTCDDTKCLPPTDVDFSFNFGSIKQESNSDQVIEDLEEINNLALEEDEIDKLIEKKKYLTSIEKIKNSLEKINFLLKGSADSNGIYENLVHSKKQISSILSLNKELFNKLDESIENTLIEYKETEAILEECMASIDENNSSLDYIENRISTIKRIARKHNIEENQINSFKNKLENSLNKLSDSENELKKRKNDININKEKYKVNAKELTDLRYKASIKLSESINKEFPILKLDNAKFAISINLLEENNWKSDGMDSVIFKIETNKDSGYDFISKIASGGELSRIMLAIKVSIASEYENSIAKTLIFDEVDTGVGGAVADAVGKRLNLLAKHNQVLAVTHHPQVAARAGNHFKVNKNNINSYSSTSINNLNKAERIEEIARMLSGEKITDAARNAAESLFNHNKNVL